MLLSPLHGVHGVALLQVAAGAEDLVALPGQHHAAHIGSVFCQAAPNSQQVAAHLGVERVGGFRARQGNL